MLADAKADALVENFAGQWLYLRELAHVQTEARNFDENLRQAFRRETELLFGRIVRDDRSLVDLLDADYTFVDERLARHYGIPNVHGSYFRRVQLPPDSPRRGLLGQGSMLTVTSIATAPRRCRAASGCSRTCSARRRRCRRRAWKRTSTEPRPPRATSLRQRLEPHRANPVCASCHRIMDPMGFALENFDLDRRVARIRRPGADRLHGTAGRRHAGQGSRRPAAGGAGPF